ncbi:carbon-nitrogen hydrolase family protein [Pyrobaculum neutrophilum]|uniref:Nitrilase/cyanide hydratase and apolipoprotein N-acyltransferase n=1 Tax=Pyrobaculum neutrophilum (strain DSM 2338 / JCM 9278 / NBRC 100436 / V24Sta) TaxID=444157 RepID=B1Y8W3_PYRNV|nr:carbon-nitrogen hydrolase family protein [Pyrobaculum neutrophilum]ACB40192.1 Nitrilase/cyanide hydratase and apolipoprotein N-acyltransferase [Pyrobaculum neutrophilum V24Sta]
MFRLGIAQISPGRLEAVGQLVGRSEPDLLLLPEYTNFDPTGLPPEEVWRRAATLEDFVGLIGRLAAELGAYVAGGFLERGPRPRVYNTTVLVDPGGRAVGIYRKTHLFDAYGYRESEFVEPGVELSQVYAVRGAKVAFAVCFELRFPEVFRELALAGAEVAAVPAAWYAGPLKEETLHLLARTRAVENGIYVAVSALWGPRFTGRSLVVNPFGVVEAELGAGERYRQVSIDLRLVEEARKTVPTIYLRRPRLYRRLCVEQNGEEGF